jgi:ATP-dependent DNA helicase RecG
MNESETIEFKKSLAELGEGLNSLAAILNKHGAGELWFGIKNDGSPVGMEVTETTLRKVSQAIAAHIEPKIFPEVSKVLLSGKACIRVSFSGSEKPYYSHGRAYMRVADEDRQLSAKQIETIILRKNRSHRGWDSEPITNTSFKPDTAKVRAYVRKAGLPWTNAQAALESLGLYVDGHFLNAARVFFAMPPAFSLPSRPPSRSVVPFLPPPPQPPSSTSTISEATSFPSSKKPKNTSSKTSASA